jgi:hypothetical protein
MDESGDADTGHDDAASLDQGKLIIQEGVVFHFLGYFPLTSISDTINILREHDPDRVFSLRVPHAL